MRPPRWRASASRGAKPVEELVGPAVAAYIAEHGLYRVGAQLTAQASL